MHRRAILACFALAMLLLSGFLPTDVSADKPTRVILPAEDFTAEDVCPFPVHVTFLENKEKVIRFYDKEGNVVRELVTGTLKQRLTNVTTGKSVVVNASGPGTFVEHADGTLTIEGQGRWTWFMLPGLDVGGPALLLTSGRVVATVGPEGGITEFDTSSAHVQDMCAVLAG